MNRKEYYQSQLEEYFSKNKLRRDWWKKRKEISEDGSL